MKTNVYVDGFNLYYRAVKNTPYKWLDLSKLSQKLAPGHEINRIRYFTANTKPLPNDPNVPLRQQIFIRALETIPILTVHRGHFELRQRWLPLVYPISGLPRLVKVESFEEKGSDVNLATYLLVDGFDNDFEQAFVISNDSDLALPIKMVRDKLNLSVGVVNPNVVGLPTPKELLDAASFSLRLFKTTLRDCQFPPSMMDANGIFRKPASW